MNEFRQHLPNFVDVNERLPLQEFETLDELLAGAWVRSWTAIPFFRCFSQSHHHGTEYLLIAEFDRPGSLHWVVGYLKEQVEGLPEWVPPEPAP